MAKDLSVVAFCQTHIKIIDKINRMHLIKTNYIEQWHHPITNKLLCVVGNVEGNTIFVRFINWVLSNIIIDEFGKNNMEKVEYLINNGRKS